jgi:hypothetical protein
MHAKIFLRPDGELSARLKSKQISVATTSAIVRVARNPSPVPFRKTTPHAGRWSKAAAPEWVAGKVEAAPVLCEEAEWDATAVLRWAAASESV